MTGAGHRATSRKGFAASPPNRKTASTGEYFRARRITAAISGGCSMLTSEEPSSLSGAPPTRRAGAGADATDYSATVTAAGLAASAPSADAAAVLVSRAEDRGPVAPRSAAAAARPVGSSRVEPVRPADAVARRLLSASVADRGRAAAPRVARPAAVRLPSTAKWRGAQPAASRRARWHPAYAFRGR